MSKRDRAPDDDLEAAISSAWALFGRYSIAAPLEVCHCHVCVGEADRKAMLTTSIRDWPERLVAEYTNSAHGHGRRADDQFRALLPRYFELIAEGRWPAIDASVTLARLDFSDWRANWPTDEIALVARVFVALFARWRSSREGIGNAAAQDLLGCIAYTRTPMAPFLAAWDADPTTLASVKLAETIIGIPWATGKLRLSVFWETVADAESEVIAWLRRPETRQRLVDAFFEADNPNDRAKLSEAELAIY